MKSTTDMQQLKDYGSLSQKSNANVKMVRKNVVTHVLLAKIILMVLTSFVHLIRKRAKDIT